MGPVRSGLPANPERDVMSDPLRSRLGRLSGLVSGTRSGTGLRPVFGIVCLLPAAVLLAGCDQRAAASKPATFVRTETVKLTERRTSVTLTGDVQARVRAEAARSASAARVTERLVDVGAHVNAGDVLARIDPTEQQADLDAATAAVAAARSQVRVAAATFDRQKTLLSNGFTTRAAS